MAALEKPKFELPGASSLTKYLLDHLKDVNLQGPTSIHHFGIDGKSWSVRYQGREIGKYFILDQAEGEADYKRMYEGEVPGYINMRAVEVNRISRRQLPVNQVALIWSNIEYIPRTDTERAKEVLTEWGRKDRHTSIPFP